MRLFAFASYPGLSRAQSDGGVHDSIIIGAGWAGLAAAKILKEDNFNGVIILEARDRIGGRTYTSFQFGDSIAQDMGSFTLTSANDHPLMEYLEQTNLEPVIQDSTPTFIFPNGTILSTENLENFLDEYWLPFIGYKDYTNESWETSYFMQRWREAVGDNLENKNDDYYYNAFLDAEDISLRDIVDDYMDITNFPEGDEGISLFEAQVDDYLMANHAGNTTDMSFLFFPSGNWYNGSTYTLSKQKPEKSKKESDENTVKLKSGGFKELLDKYAEDVVDQVQLNSKVTKINYGVDAREPIEVTYVGADNQEVVLKAKTVVVTVPVGILREGM